MMILILTPGRDDGCIAKLLREAATPPLLVPLDVSFEEIRGRMRARVPLGLTAGTGETSFNLNPSLVQVTGRSTLDDHWFDHVYDERAPVPTPDDHDPRIKNKAARRKREATKASQNARGRKWWEHR